MPLLMFLNVSTIFSITERCMPTSKLGKKISLDSKKGIGDLNDDDDDDYSKSFDFKYSNKRVVDCNKENNLHYVRYQHLGDRSIKIWQCGVCKCLFLYPAFILFLFNPFYFFCFYIEI